MFCRLSHFLILLYSYLALFITYHLFTNIELDALCLVTDRPANGIDTKVRVFISDKCNITALLNMMSKDSKTLDTSNIEIGVIPLRLLHGLEDVSRVAHEHGDEVDNGLQCRGTDYTKSMSVSALIMSKARRCAIMHHGQNIWRLPHGHKSQILTYDHERWRLIFSVGGTICGL